MRIACRHERQSHPLRKCDRELQRLPLDLDAVVLNLDEVTITKRAMEPSGMFFAAQHGFFFGVAREQRAAQLARHAAAQANQSLAVRRQQLAIDSRLVIKAFQKSLAGELDEILKASPIRSEHRQVVPRFAMPASTLVETAARRDVRLVTNYR